MLKEEFRQILIDRFESWELCDFLQVSTEDFIDAFEELIEENIEEVSEFAGLQGEDNVNGD